MSSKRNPRKRSRPLGIALGLSLVVIAFAAAATGVVFLLNQFNRPSGQSLQPGCTATVDGNSYTLALDQSDNAALISALALSRGLPAHAATIALATAMQESKLRNIDYGDKDSLGLFQQRPSQGWGSPAEILDRVYSTNRFYDGLVKVPGWQSMDVAQAAQAVQRSADGSAYAAHEAPARAFASALTGNSPHAFSCTVTASATTGSATSLASRIRQDFGQLSMDVEGETQNSPAHVTITQAANMPQASDEQSHMWAYAQWAVAMSSGYNVTEVDLPGWRWTRASHSWQPAPTTEGGASSASPSAGTVLIVLAR